MSAKLCKLGITRLQDLWFHLPLRYEDRTRIEPIAALEAGTRAQVEGVVAAVERGFRFRPQLKVAIADDSQRTLLLRFFHFNRAHAERFVPGSRWRVYGDVRAGAQGLEIVHPECRRLDVELPLESALTPVYPATDGIHPKRMLALVRQALTRLPGDAELECIPAPLVRRLKLGSLRDALARVHQPPANAPVEALLAGTDPAQQRLAFDELLAHQLSLRQNRRLLKARPAPRFEAAGARRAALLESFGFALTAAQARVLEEIECDLADGRPMLRLVQGDVGSGKTAVAALAAQRAIDGGWQAALLAPTEVLAEQHRANLARWLEPLGIKVAWLSGGLTLRQRRDALAAIAGSADLVVGTHALLEDSVAFRRLGLVIVDEQHRFGVRQRLAIKHKGPDATQAIHQLVLSATPIPRTLAMATFADLDLSVIDELPPGRTPVATVVVNQARRDEVIERIRVALDAGRQVYWVCTLIEESELLEAQAVDAAHAALVAALPGREVGLIHGRLKASEKQRVMAGFKSGATTLLVATTVIEVGVDVPNASLMVIENAERLGLAQLHQLRGRVGRGSVASSCVLLYQPPLSNLARQRLDVMRETNDGFRIAEKDLALRGPGEILGTRQTGLAAFRVANLARDAALLPDVARVAETLLGVDPGAADRLVTRWIGASLRYAEA